MRHGHRPVGAAGDDVVEVAPALVVGRRVVEPAVRAAALGPRPGAPGDRLGDGQQVVELEHEVPARVVDPVADRPDGAPALAERRQLRRAPRRGRPPRGRSRPGAASCPGGRGRWRTGPRRSVRSSGAASSVDRRPDLDRVEIRLRRRRPRVRPPRHRSAPRRPAGPTASCHRAGSRRASRRRPRPRRTARRPSSPRSRRRPGSRP